MKSMRKKHTLLESNVNWLEDEPKWYMLYVKSGNLKKVSDDLNRQDVFSYRPIAKSLNFSGSGRLRTNTHLFMNNMFVHLSRKNLRFIPYSSEKISFVYRIDKPVFITDDELELMHRFLRKNYNISVQGMNEENHAVFFADEEPGYLEATSQNMLPIHSLGCKIASQMVASDTVDKDYFNLRKQIAFWFNSFLFQFDKTSA